MKQVGNNSKIAIRGITEEIDFTYFFQSSLFIIAILALEKVFLWHSS